MTPSASLSVWRRSSSSLTPVAVDRFEGRICGVGTREGSRIVVGRWDRSPLGEFADVMVESRDGHRLLVAPSRAVAEYVGSTYRFDEVRVQPVAVEESTGRWDVHAGPVQVAVSFGGRLPLGRVLHAIPTRLATERRWAAATDLVARVVLPGVRTTGSAGGGRRETYCVTDLVAVTAVVGEVFGRDVIALAPVDPPTRFGFSSTPRTPSLASVVTYVESPSR